MTACDEFGVIGDGLYRQRHNPDFYVDGIRADQLTSARIARGPPINAALRLRSVATNPVSAVQVRPAAKNR